MAARPDVEDLTSKWKTRVSVKTQIGQRKFSAPLVLVLVLVCCEASVVADVHWNQRQR